jgi:predicted nucleotidyltransferase
MSGVLTDKLAAVSRLCRQYHVQRLELFGSATSAAFDPARSDLDFLVEFEPAGPVEHAERYFGLLAALQDLLGRNVDLVEVRAIRNPYFLQAVQSSRTLIYAA